MADPKGVVERQLAAFNSHDVPPTGRSVAFSWQSMYEVRDGELAAEHLIFDRADLMEQLGLAGETKR